MSSFTTAEGEGNGGEPTGEGDEVDPECSSECGDEEERGVGLLG